MADVVHRKGESRADAHAQTVPPESGAGAAAEFLPGRVVGGKYLIESRIGEGGLT